VQKLLTAPSGIRPCGHRRGKRGDFDRRADCGANARNGARSLNVNLFGNFLTMKAACPRQQTQGSASSSRSIPSPARQGARRIPPMPRRNSRHRPRPERRRWKCAARVRCNAICPGNLLDSPLWTDPNNGLFTQYLKTAKCPCKNRRNVRQFLHQSGADEKRLHYDDIAAR